MAALEITDSPCITYTLCRHPFALQPCVPAGKNSVGVQDRACLLLLGMDPERFHRTYPGRNYFFDLGTSKFPDSLGWFTSEYRARGVEFDEIWVRQLGKGPIIIASRLPVTALHFL
jgi:hypothetical protein